jgi:hypothetical protein
LPWLPCMTAPACVRGCCQPDFGMEAQPRPPNTAADIEALRASGQLAAQILDQACAAVAVGVTTEEVDAAAHSGTACMTGCGETS